MELEIKQPPITCYLHHAYQLTVSMSHKDFDSWFLSNYIQLEYVAEQDILNFFTYVICGNCVYNPLINYRILDLEYIFKTNIDIIEFVKKSIEAGYYIVTYIDEFYIPERNAYKKEHFKHELMIYGFDLSKKEFKLLGYNNKNIYSTSSVSFSEFNNGYLNSVDQNNDVLLLKAKNDNSWNPSYNFDIENVKNLLSDYLYSENSSERLRSIGNPNKYIYGLSVYKYLIKCYEEIIRSNNKQTDIRHFYLLYEHKKTMVARLKYLTEKGYLNNSNNYISLFLELQKDAFNARNLIIKYDISGSKELINEVILCLKKMYETESKVIEDLLKNIIG